ncbi:MAG: type II toxin-antitoxin system MqsA family antitoxin [Magnetococcales bacterium]|nr:type II toxin-antitoxin system MqsA family antitoxin [Magnetococcales bacterium]
MKCIFCRNGETQPGETTVTLEREGTTVLIKAVPADICDNCGEYYLSDKVTEQVLARAQQARENGAEIEILRFAA